MLHKRHIPRPDNWLSVQSLVYAAAVTVAASAVLYAYVPTNDSPTTTETETATVATGTVRISLKKSGTVLLSTPVRVEAKVAGEVLSIPVSAGSKVAAGTPLILLDPTDAGKALERAEANLTAATLALDKLLAPVSTSTLTAAQNLVATSEAAVAAAYETSYNDVVAAYLSLGTVTTGLNTVLHDTTVPGRTFQQNIYAYNDVTVPYDGTVVQYRAATEAAYLKLADSYTKGVAKYRETPRTASHATLEALVQETYAVSLDASDALKAASTFLSFVNTTLTNKHISAPSTLAGHITSVTTYASTINTHVAKLSADTTAFTTNLRVLENARAILDAAQSGTSALEITAAQNLVLQQKQAVALAKENLAHMTIRAPFSGTVSSIEVGKFETVSPGTHVAGLEGTEQSVSIGLSEAESVALAIGAKARIVFDMDPPRTTSGTISFIDTHNTSRTSEPMYETIVTFDTPQKDVRPRSHAQVEIVQAPETGLVVPVRALIKEDGQTYVDVVHSTSAPNGTSTPLRTFVIPGAQDSEHAVVRSGLSVGDTVLVPKVP